MYIILRSPVVSYVIVRCICIRGICGTRAELSFVYSRVTTVVYFLRERNATGRPHATLTLRFFRYDHLPGMNRKSQDDEARNGQHTLSIERYFPFLLAMLKNTRMYASEQFLTFKIVFLTGLAVFFMVLIFVNLIADIGIIIVGVNADQFADVVSILSTHIVGLIKWLYCTTNNRKLFGITQKLERCHVLCQRIDSTVEGT